MRDSNITSAMNSDNFDRLKFDFHFVIGKENFECRHSALLKAFIEATALGCAMHRVKFNLGVWWQNFISLEFMRQINPIQTL